MNWSEVQKRYDVIETNIEVTPTANFNLAQIRDINALVDKMGPDEFGPDERLPYWSSLWPVSLCLANYILRHPELVQSPAIELGCGLGLVSMAIASLNVDMLATDYEPEAIAFTQHNAKNNKLRVKAQQWDWRELNHMPKGFPTIVGADVLYEPKNIKPVADAIAHLIQPGGRAIIADPNRPHWPQFQDILSQNGLQVMIIHVESYIIIDVKSRIGDYEA